MYMYQDLSTCHDWPVKKAKVNLLIKMNGNSKHTSGNSLSPLGAEIKDIHTASQMLLTEVYLCLRRRILSKGAFHLPELTGQTIPVVMGNSLLIKTIQPDQSNPK